MCEHEKFVKCLCCGKDYCRECLSEHEADREMSINSSVDGEISDD